MKYIKEYLIQFHGKFFTPKFRYLHTYTFFQILKPSEKKAKYQYQGLNQARPVTPRGPTGVPGMKRK